MKEGKIDGWLEGLKLGTIEGFWDGEVEEIKVGTIVGFCDGTNDIEGKTEGTNVEL